MKVQKTDMNQLQTSPRSCRPLVSKLRTAELSPFSQRSQESPSTSSLLRVQPSWDPSHLEVPALVVPPLLLDLLPQQPVRKSFTIIAPKLTRGKLRRRSRRRPRRKRSLTTTWDSVFSIKQSSLDSVSKIHLSQKPYHLEPLESVYIYARFYMI